MSVVEGAAITVQGALTRDQVEAVADGAHLVLGDRARAEMEASHRALMGLLAEGAQVYGASSGVGDLRDVPVAPAARDELQRNIVRSHCCGMGKPLPTRLVRAALALRAATLARGCSAVRPVLVERMLAMLNRGIHPFVPAHGSVGASGDPVLLAHLALGVLGEGRAQAGDGRFRAAADLSRDAGLEPLALTGREGLALLNGLDFSLAAATLLQADAERLLGWGDAIAALTLDALGAASASFAPDLQRLRGDGPHRDVAARINRLRRGDRVAAGGTQDPYCLRCIPQVHGVAWTTLGRHAATVDHELAAVIDNPLVFADGSVHHCGHFHGQELALSADQLALGVTSLANIAQARLSLLLRGAYGLPRMLSRAPGARCGLMMLETTGASLVARMRAMATPLSIQSLPASSEQEDHTSMAWEATRRTQALLPHLAAVLATEAMAAAEALRLRGAPTAEWMPATVRAVLGERPCEPAGDRPRGEDLELLRTLLLREEAPSVA